MSVSFGSLPAAMRAPLFYAEVDRSAANQGGADVLKTLLVGQRTSTGSKAAGLLTRITSAAQALAFYGRGSMLHRMAMAYFAGDALGEVYAISLDDNGAGVPAAGSIKCTTLPSAAGVLSFYIAGTLVSVSVTTSDTKITIAQKIEDAIDALPDLPVTALTDGIDKVDITAKNDGPQGNDIDLRLNYLGEAGGESTPAGSAWTIVAMAAGATEPSTVPAIDAMADEAFEFVAWPYTSTTALNLLRDELADNSTGRWGPMRQLYGHAFSALRNTVGNLTTAGNLRNDPHVTIAGIDKSPSWTPEIAAAMTAAVAGSIRVDPARPLHTLPLVGILAPEVIDRFSLTERNTLLFDGIATLTSSRAGEVAIERAITTYQLNTSSAPDASCLDSETLFTLAAILRRLRSAITSKFGRHKIVNDGTRIGAGQAATTPGSIRGELIAQYRAMEADGWVENADAFKANLVVERNGLDPSRVDVLFPPDLANGLRVFALLNQFRLQYPAATAA